VERLNDPVLEVTGKDEATVPREFLHKISECWLGRVSVEIISFVEDDVFSSTIQRD
jgi:hypothetical protein